MKEEYENKLSEDFTFIDSNMFIETGDGWFQLIYDLCKEIEAVYKREGIVANIIVDAIYVRIPLKRNSLHASAGRLSAPNGKLLS